MSAVGSGNKFAARSKSESSSALASLAGKRTTEYSLKMRLLFRDAETSKKYVKDNFNLPKEVLAVRCQFLEVERVSSGLNP